MTLQCPRASAVLLGSSPAPRPGLGSSPTGPRGPPARRGSSNLRTSYAPPASLSQPAPLPAATPARPACLQGSPGAELVLVSVRVLLLSTALPGPSSLRLHQKTHHSSPTFFAHAHYSAKHDRSLIVDPHFSNGIVTFQHLRNAIVSVSVMIVSVSVMMWVFIRSSSSCDRHRHHAIGDSHRQCHGAVVSLHRAVGRRLVVSVSMTHGMSHRQRDHDSWRISSRPSTTADHESSTRLVGRRLPLSSWACPLASRQPSR